MTIGYLFQITYLLGLGVVAACVVLWLRKLWRTRDDNAPVARRTEYWANAADLTLRMRKWADSTGLTFVDLLDEHFFYGFRQLQCLQMGCNRYALNIARGTFRERKILVFDYCFTELGVGGRGGSSFQQWQFSAVIVESPMPLEPLQVRPEKLADHLAGTLGFHDIQLESDEFNRIFHISANHKRWAFDVLTPRVMELLMDHPKFGIELSGRNVIAYGPGVLRAEELERAAELLCDILDILPEYLADREDGIVEST